MTGALEQVLPACCYRVAVENVTTELPVQLSSDEKWSPDSIDLGIALTVFMSRVSTPRQFQTRSSAVTERPRDVSCHSVFC